MDQLPCIDDYASQIDASPEQVWHALLTTLRERSPKLPDCLTTAWGLQHPMRTGAWDETVAVGHTLLRFVARGAEHTD